VVDLHKSIKATNRMWAGKSPVLACCLLNGTEIPLGKLRMALNLGEASLPMKASILKGVHNLLHTFGRWLSSSFACQSLTDNPSTHWDLKDLELLLLRPSLFLCVGQELAGSCPTPQANKRNR
jgi:hypothetical protein